MVAPRLFVLLDVPPDISEDNEYLRSQIKRFSDFRDFTWRLPAEGAFLSDRALRKLREYRPQIVHIRHLKHVSNPSDNGRLQTFARRIVELTPSMQCLVLEDCFDLPLAWQLSEKVSFVMGINGRFAETFFHNFYANIVTDGLYHEIFDEALWQSSQNDERVRAPANERPYCFTRDVRAFEHGYAFRFMSGTPGAGVARQLFEPYLPVERPVKYPVFYGTNRKPVASGDPTKGYSGERDERLHLGTCKVVVPKSHKIGSLGTPWWKALLMLRPRDDKLTLQWSSLRTLADEKYWAKIRLSSSRRFSNLLYIHGYNVTFELAALRAAQLGVDLKINGVMSFFSWPSKGKFSQYPADEASIEASESALSEYLHNLVTYVGNRQLNVIAHSMGNRAFLRSLHQVLHRVADKTGIKFGQIFLAAPDIDTQVFRNLASVYKRVSKRTTLYVSARDKALATSGHLHDYPRAGFTPPVTIVPGIDTVETTNIDLSFLGHGYFADAWQVLNDMHELIRHDTPPDDRFAINSRAKSHIGNSGEVYWGISA